MSAIDSLNLKTTETPISARMYAQQMRVKNASNLPEYLVIPNPKINYIPPPKKPEGKFTAIPIRANILGRENSYEHLNIPQTQYKMANGLTPHEAVLQRLLKNMDRPIYNPVKLPETSPSQRSELEKQLYDKY